MSPGHAPPYGMLPSGTGFTALFSTGYAFAALDDQGAGSLNSRTFTRLKPKLNNAKSPREIRPSWHDTVAQAAVATARRRWPDPALCREHVAVVDGSRHRFEEAFVVLPTIDGRANAAHVHKGGDARDVRGASSL